MPEKKKDQTIEEVLYEVLLELFKLECSKVFHYPVDVIQSQCPNYYEVIKSPMDLTTLKVFFCVCGDCKNNFREGRYEKVEDVYEDLQLIIRNCRQYNSAAHPIQKTADKFEQCFMTRWKKDVVPALKERNLDLNLQSPLEIDIEKLNQIEQKKMKKRDPALPPPQMMPQLPRTTSKPPPFSGKPPPTKPKSPELKKKKEQIFLEDEDQAVVPVVESVEIPRPEVSTGNLLEPTPLAPQPPPQPVSLVLPVKQKPPSPIIQEFSPAKENREQHLNYSRQVGYSLSPYTLQLDAEKINQDYIEHLKRKIIKQFYLQATIRNNKLLQKMLNTFLFQIPRYLQSLKKNHPKIHFKSITHLEKCLQLILSSGTNFVSNEMALFETLEILVKWNQRGLVHLTFHEIQDVNRYVDLCLRSVSELKRSTKKLEKIKNVDSLHHHSEASVEKLKQIQNEIHENCTQFDLSLEFELKQLSERIEQQFKREPQSTPAIQSIGQVPVALEPLQMVQTPKLEERNSEKQKVIDDQELNKRLFELNGKIDLSYIQTRLKTKQLCKKDIILYFPQIPTKKNKQINPALKIARMSPVSSQRFPLKNSRHYKLQSMKNARVKNIISSCISQIFKRIQIESFNSQRAPTLSQLDIFTRSIEAIRIQDQIRIGQGHIDFQSIKLFNSQFFVFNEKSLRNNDNECHLNRIYEEGKQKTKYLKLDPFDFEDTLGYQLILSKEIFEIYHIDNILSVLFKIKYQCHESLDLNKLPIQLELNIQNIVGLQQTLNFRDYQSLNHQFQILIAKNLNEPTISEMFLSASYYQKNKYFLEIMEDLKIHKQTNFHFQFIRDGHFAWGIKHIKFKQQDETYRIYLQLVMPYIDIKDVKIKINSCRIFPFV